MARSEKRGSSAGRTVKAGGDHSIYLGPTTNVEARLKCPTLLFGHPAIQEACVVATRDARSGQAVKAFVVVRAGADVSAEQIIEWAHEHMAAYKVPQMVEFTSALPRTGSGKVQWRVLQELENRVS